MRIALTGVSGFIGSVTARHLAAAGHQVTALVRSTSRRDHIEDVVDRFVVGDHADERCWPALLDGADAVIHNSVDWDFRKSGEEAFDDHLQSNIVGSLRLLKASAPRQFVFVSSIAVHHDMRPRWGV
ncbi:MAG: NAD(P)-dependent oxidoreductase [Phycisphaerales bacterium]